ncbi:uncharacterized protein LOC129915093, partial [Episyrphus balteatus]|uniref:uncharacterized protein LOC129915093 n=1 Tax=Episyrphus balteatus TaxID=286459 RepID=UPI0024869797
CAIYNSLSNFIFTNIGVDIAYEAIQELATLNSNLNKLYAEEEPRQVAIPSNPLGALASRIPCSCDKGVCKCCTSMLSLVGLNGCMEVVYKPEDFAFDLRMKLNNRVLFERSVSGKNPPPFCFRPPRFGFVRACIKFYDVYFFGRNMHVCMDLSGYFQGYELFERSYDCLQLGMKGVKIVKPEEGYPLKPTDVEIDQGDDDIEDYDENVVRSI